jgi:hypothetical protein
MKLAFNLHQKVKILELNLIGRVRAIYIESDGITYSVRYFKDGDAKSAYFYADELEKTEVQKNNIGYKNT